MPNAGKFFVIMGPSGVGKTTLVNALVALDGCQKVMRVPTYTTRTKRPGEVDGVDYFFISEVQFQEMIKTGGVLEWSRAYRAYYGLGRKIVEDALLNGKTVLAVVDRLGAIEVKKLMPQVVTILIVAPSREELRRRLELRSSESSQNVEFRLQRADEEAALEKTNPIADQVVVNDNLDAALESLKKVVCG
jgi:guanylate kinase